jgi:hypothetical protein
MFQRNISINEIVFSMQEGVVIKEYPEDKPYPGK